MVQGHHLYHDFFHAALYPAVYAAADRGLIPAPKLDAPMKESMNRITANQNIFVSLL
jgi:hypothetical protein